MYILNVIGCLVGVQVYLQRWHLITPYGLTAKIDLYLRVLSYYRENLQQTQKVHLDRGLFFLVDIKTWNDAELNDTVYRPHSTSYVLVHRKTQVF